MLRMDVGVRGGRSLMVSALYIWECPEIEYALKVDTLSERLPQ